MNFKIIAFTSVTAFVLSFFTALISGAGFGRSFLRAIITGIVFGGISALVQWLYNRFLNDDSSGAGSASDIGVENSRPVLGNKVDIVVSDEELQEEEDDPKFILTGQNQMLNKDDLGSSGFVYQKESAGAKPEMKDLTNEESPASSPVKSPEPREETKASPASQEEPPSFKPVPLAKAEQSPSVSQAKKTDADSGEADNFPPIENAFGGNSIFNGGPEAKEDDVVDDLPDMSGTPAGLKDDAVTDSDFATSGKSTSRLNETVFPDGSKADSKDTKLMAEAIRTIFRNEE